MHKYLWILPAIFLFNTCNKSVDKEAESKALLETGKEWAKSAAAGDLENVFRYWTDDAVIYPVGMPAVKGKDAIRKFVAANRSQKNFSLITHPLEATVSKAGDIGYTVGNYQVSMNAPGGSPIIRKGRYLCAWRKVDGSWKCNLEIHSPLGMPPDMGANTQHQLEEIPEYTPNKNTEVEKNKSITQKYIDEMNKRNEDYLNNYFATDYIYHGPNGDLDIDGFKKMHHSVLSAFPDVVIKAEDIIASGDKVVTRWKIHGTQKGMFMGVKPTGKEITIKGIIISRFENGKVVEEWEEANGVNIMQQLGIFPPPKN